MELRSVILGQAIQFVEAQVGEAPRSPVPLIRTIQDRYGFVEVPTKVSELDLNVGIKFRQGYFENKVINTLQVFDKGLLCEAVADSNICEKLIDEILDYIPKHYNILVSKRPRKAFQSVIEVNLSKDISAKFPQFTKAGAIIGSALESYGLTSTGFRMSGIEMHLPDSQNELGHPEFVLAKRKGHPYEDNIYFSKAPLRTTDHLAVIAELEQII